jgi:hypothetical protein
MKAKLVIYRQGDVLIEEVNEVPHDAVKQKRQSKIILARGEATGHHHALEMEDPADWWKHGDEIYVDLANSPQVAHQEHATIQLRAKQIVRVRRQREYTPETIRNVAD